MITSSYPSNKAPEVGQLYQQILEKTPLDETLVKQITPILLYPKEGEVRTIQITLPAEGKLEEALNRTFNVVIQLGAIEGYKYDVQLVNTAENIMAILES